MIALTHAYYIKDDIKEQDIMRPYAPLGILSISAYLKKNLINHLVFDSTFESQESQMLFLIENNIKLLGIYVNLMTKLNVLRLINSIRENEALRDCKIVLGGPDLRYNALEYLTAGASLLVLGEGELTFYEVCKSYTQSGSLGTEISGTAFLDGTAKLKITEERALLKDINELPMPARAAIDITKYLKVWKQKHGYSMLSVSTMRGCPYTCKWCSRAVYGGSYRRRSPKLVVDELKNLQETYAPDKIWFVDDVFTISHKWLKEFCEELKKQRVKIPYEIITRADRMSAEVIDLLKDSGCFRVWIGAESGSQTIIDAMDRRVDVKIVQEMIQKTRLAGIEAGTFIMLGYPGETRADIKATIKHLQIAEPDVFTITVAYPIAGTPLFDEVKESLTAELEWNKRTDRELDFKRRHPKQFYTWAVRWVNNAVLYKRSKFSVKKVRYFVNSQVAQTLMLFNR
jgi:radical SAM superfamily enzyme YgiQ (UPF0313 family)